MFILKVTIFWGKVKRSHAFGGYVCVCVYVCMCAHARVKEELFANTFSPLMCCLARTLRA